MKKFLLLSFFFFYSFCFSQLTFIPDDNFEYYIETHDKDGFFVGVGDPESMGNGIVGDNLVDSNKIANAETIVMENAEVEDLTGINEFINLYQLYIYFNLLTTLEVNIPSLWTIGCSGNNLTSIDISGCTGLENFVANDNFLEYIDLSKNIALDEVYLNNNLLAGNFDFSNNSSLSYVQIKNNLVRTIDMRNRNSPSIPFEFDATNNPNLTCVFVDNENEIPSGWIIDSSARYEEDEIDCPELGLEDFEKNKKVIVYPNPIKNYFTIENIENIQSVEVIDFSGKTLSKFSVKEKYIVENIDNGIYLLVINTPSGMIYKKIIIK